MRKAILLSLLTFLVATGAEAKLELPTILGDHMVLQAGVQANIWGKDNPGQAVTVTLAGQSASTAADKKGDWKLSFPVLQAGGPHEMTVSGSETLTVKDVLVGEVWLGSGQSNMEFILNNTHDADREVPKADFPQIRLFTHERALAASPGGKTVGTWKVCSPATAKDFSAVAYHFGKAIHADRKVPVGLIASSWGGTLIETWMSGDTLGSDPAFLPIVEKWNAKSQTFKDLWVKGTEIELRLSGLKFIPKDSTKPAVTVLLKPGAAGNSLGSGNWSGNAMNGSSIGYSFEEKGGPQPGPVGILKGKFQGGAWGSCLTNLSADGKPLDLTAFQAVEFQAKGKGSFKLNLSQPSITDWDLYGSNEFMATDKWEIHRISLAGLKQGGWGKPQPFTQDAMGAIFFNVVLPYQPEMPGGIYNGMIAPLTPFRIRGALWYQGESNWFNAALYRSMLPAMIRGWRQAWGQGDFPFIIAQLPAFQPVKDYPTESAWAELREAQLLATKEPATYMATLIDLGDAIDIHPRNKTDVGYRMSLPALAQVYGKAVEFSGPLYDSMTVEGNKVRIRFKHAEKGLAAKGGDLKGFAIQGESGGFQWAKAKIDKDSVLVWSDGISSPKAVRYAWADNPVCNLYGKNGLPASPFRTDKP